MNNHTPCHLEGTVVAEVPLDTAAAVAGNEDAGPIDPMVATRRDLDAVGAVLERLWAQAMVDGPGAQDVADRLATAARQVRLAGEVLDRHLLR